MYVEAVPVRVDALAHLSAARRYYDLTRDPYELVNRYDSLPSNTLAALRSRVTAYRQCAGESCRVADSS